MTKTEYERYITETGETDIDAIFWTCIELEAAKYEVTADYYMEEFL